jgi:hypothetical protein
LDLFAIDEDTFSTESGCDAPIAVSATMPLKKPENPSFQVCMFVGELHQLQLVIEAAPSQSGDHQQVRQRVFLP